jgi:uncharacterized membrane protein
VTARRGSGAFLIVLAIAALARIWTLGDRNVWLDEAASWQTASHPVPGVIASAATDVHPPLYYLLLKGWMAVAGDSPTGMRSLSVLFGLIAVVLAFRLAAGWLPRPVALAALGWIAVSPLQVFFSQEARMYAPATALVLASCLAYRRWLDQGCRRITPLVWFVVTSAGALYLHYFTALILPALWIHFAVIGRGRQPAVPAAGRPTARKAWLVANGAVLLLFLPWLPIAVRQIATGQPWREAVSLSRIPEHALWLVVDLLAGYHFTWTPLLAISFALIAAVAAVGWAMLVRRGTGFRTDVDLWLLLVTGVPISAGLLALPFAGDMRLSRYLSFLVPFVAIGAARGVSRMAAGPGTLTAIVGAATLGSLPWLLAYSNDSRKDTDVRPVIRAIETASEADAGDLVAVEPGSMDICLRYYWRDRTPNLVRVPEDRSRWAVLAEAARQGPVWYVAARDAAGVGADEAPSDLSLIEVRLEPHRPDDIRLYRVRLGHRP